MTRFFLPALMLISASAVAQDPQFSQYHANPLSQNPAFAGQTGSSRLILTYRNQWPALGTTYQTWAASFDTYLEPDRGSIGIGWGVQALHDRQGAFVQTNQVSAMGALNLTLLTTRNQSWQLVWGIQSSYRTSRFDASGISFVDQFSPGGTISPTSADPLAGVAINQNQLDFGTGLLLENNTDRANLPTYRLGGAIHHLGQSLDRFNPIGQRLSLQASIRIPTGLDIAPRGLGHESERDRSFTLTGQYRQQGQDKQLDVGINLTYSPVMVGLWYRNIPFRRYNQTSQRDALVGLLAVHLDQIMVQYSYDLTISSLAWASGGSHEITIWYGFDSLFSFSSKRRQANRARRCVNF
ncbi:PorP/SprF family type IX secretion system membrane protein [uncultured Fibrella sp.]|uniref:PorP/SprF family type IX secretion system membrane protein n=1 Tax=uncultured Fibrella sp. TaxID=1284596 RepID=UPI0035CB8312